MTASDRWQWMHYELEQLKGKAQYRTLHTTAAAGEGWILKNGRRMLNLASNDYLGLGQIPYERRTGSDSEIDLSGLRAGSGASRLITGNDPVCTRFEQEFAAFKGTEGCLLFGSGYMANIGILSSILQRGDEVFSDRLNHASIVDGIILSRAEHHRYRHKDLDHLESLLKKSGPGKKKLIVTDTVFSMDGDLAPLQELVELKERYGAMLMVDEAHSGGVYGQYGEGLVHSLGLDGRVDIQMGTFSKAYGVYGAYAAGDSILIEYLINKARSFIFTTALPPMVVQAVHDHWRRSVREGWRRERLHENAVWFRGRLKALGFDTGLSESQIIPLMIGGNREAVAFSEKLQEEGIAAVAIRPPTVPEGQARIRFSLMGTHAYSDLEEALGMIEVIGKELAIL